MGYKSPSLLPQDGIGFEVQFYVPELPGVSGGAVYRDEVPDSGKRKSFCPGLQGFHAGLSMLSTAQLWYGLSTL